MTYKTSIADSIIFTGIILATATVIYHTNCGFWGIVVRGLCGWGYVLWHYWFKHMS